MKAVAVLDMTGFTRSLEKEGRERTIARIEELRFHARQGALVFKGEIIGAAGDTVIALLPDVGRAVGYCSMVLAALQGRVSAGVGFGEVELTDVGWMGLELNLASRLGEDVAGPGELRLTQAAQEAIETGSA